MMSCRVDRPRNALHHGPPRSPIPKKPYTHGKYVIRDPDDATKCSALPTTNEPPTNRARIEQGINDVEQNGTAVSRTAALTTKKRGNPRSKRVVQDPEDNEEEALPSSPARKRRNSPRRATNTSYLKVCAVEDRRQDKRNREEGI